MLRMHSARSSSSGPCLIAALGAALLIGFMIPRPSFLSEADTEGFGFKAENNAAVPVRVDFYGESLCPDCQHMVLDILQPMFDNGIAECMHLRYIAYGNVRGSFDDDKGIQCQHGPVECQYNRYINCAQAKKPDQKEWFPLVSCLAKHMRELESRAADCAENAGFSANDLAQCADGTAGEELERKAAEATGALKPKHTFVPWIVVNGVPLGGDFENLDRHVCAAIPSKQRPEACYELPRGLDSMGR